MNYEQSNYYQGYPQGVAPDYWYSGTETAISPNTPVQGPNPTVGSFEIEKDPEDIHHYLCWSILNTLCGVLILGLIAIAYSVRVRSSLKLNNFEEARKWSKRALIANIIGTIGTLAVCSVAIYQIAVITQATHWPSSAIQTCEDIGWWREEGLLEVLTKGLLLTIDTEYNNEKRFLESKLYSTYCNPD